MTLFVEIIYVFVCIVLILVVLLQAGRGGGLGTALGGGASQSVFGGGGGADFLAKLTQGLATSFMICAVFLAYASAHTGSDRLQDESNKLNAEDIVDDGDAAVDYERIGPNPLPLPDGPPTAAAIGGDVEPDLPEPELPEVDEPVGDADDLLAPPAGGDADEDEPAPAPAVTDDEPAPAPADEPAPPEPAPPEEPAEPAAE
jgi:preprotein translocase subunit SecG